MRIVCPNCTTGYDIEASVVGAARTVRCAECRETWVARAPAALAAATPPSWEPDVRDAAPEEDAMPAAVDLDVAEAAVAPRVIADAPPLAPDMFEADATPEEPEPPEDIESVAARRARLARERRRRRRRWRALPATILLCGAILLALVGWRGEVVRLVPQTADIFAAIGLPVNLRGLSFEDLRISHETKDDVPVMVVEGRIVNIARHDAEVPRLRFAVRNAAGLEVYAWTALPEQSALKAGQSMPFRSRLASPPADAKDVTVRFFVRRDLVAGQ